MSFNELRTIATEYYNRYGTIKTNELVLKIGKAALLVDVQCERYELLATYFKKELPKRGA